MTTDRAIFLQTRARFLNFRKSAGETPSLPSLVTRLLGFVLNQKMSVMTPILEIEFVGMIVSSKKMTISLPQKYQ